MKSGVARVLLRSAAIAIVIAAMIDPVLSVGSAGGAAAVVVNMTANDAPAIENRVRQSAGGSELISRRLTDHRLPCALGERCIVVADGSIEAVWPSDLPIPASLVIVRGSATPNVFLRAASITPAQHLRAGGAAEIMLDGTGMAGRRTEIRLTDGTALVGAATHEWKADGLVTMTVPWWPIATGPRVIRVHANPSEAESTTFDNTIDVGVSIGADRLPVLVFDPRPSWNSTFTRRALEDDSRFVVEHRARVAPAISAGTMNGRLDEQALDAAAVIVVGAPDALSPADVDVIERFVRLKGGTAILLPERAPSGPASRLFAGRWVEQLSASAEPVGLLRAGEILRTDVAPITASVLAHAGTWPSIVVTPAGNGRIVVSGAMDAWRYRDHDAGAFDRFWRSLVAESAAAGAALQLTFENRVASPGSRERFTVRSRRSNALATSAASAVGRCGDGPAQTIRLWPTGARDTFHGELPIDDRGPCTIEASMNDRRITAGIAVMPAARRGAQITLARLERDARAADGAIATEGDLSPIAIARTAADARDRRSSPTHPMRSAWWIWIFTGCLSAEWWLRRRAGLR